MCATGPRVLAAALHWGRCRCGLEVGLEAKRRVVVGGRVDCRCVMRDASRMMPVFAGRSRKREREDGESGPLGKKMEGVNGKCAMVVVVVVASAPEVCMKHTPLRRHQGR